MFKRKEKSCIECGRKYFPFTSLHTFCSSPCMFKFNSEKEVKKRFKEIKSSVSFEKIKAKAKRIFQAWTRKRDENLPCISCGRTNTKQWDGGHYFKAELYSGLIFFEMNVNKQCVYCNRDLDGNLINYRIGLVKKYGSYAVEGLEEIAASKKQYKYSRTELEEIINKYKLKKEK